MQPVEQEPRWAGAFAGVLAVTALVTVASMYRVAATRRDQRTMVREVQRQAGTQEDREYAHYLASFFLGCSALPAVFGLCEPLPQEEWARTWREAQKRIAEEHAKRRQHERERSPVGDFFPNDIHGMEEPLWPTGPKVRLPKRPASRRTVSPRGDAGVDDPLAGLDSL